MTEPEVVALMESSKSEREWNDNCDKVKAACFGYPRFWYEAIMLSGLAHRVRQSWVTTAARNLLPKSPEPVGGVTVFELLPPTPEEIEEIRKKGGKPS